MGGAVADRPAGHVVEFGAGMGAVTRQLLRSGVSSEQLTLMEIDSRLGGHLRRSFPELDVIIAPAQQLAKLWQERNGPPVGAVVSTLPMRLFSKKSIMSVMRNSLSVLEPGGVFVQLTYRPSSPAPERICAALGVTAERYCRVWINLPPAGIWIFRKPLG
jgi:phosphatidylethanolamine/phosphatidyl-N-methylethanolamine N-methyltransferase